MKTKTVKITDLKRNLFVRSRLDQDRAIQMALHLENGGKLPPIKVNPDMMVIDGRHRIEAHELNGRSEIEAEVLSITSEVELIAEAYRSNIGGPLPPTTQDTEQTVEMLLERGGNIKTVAEMLSLPPGIARHYVNSVKSRMKRKKLASAISAVTDGGLTIGAACEKYAVPQEDLREQLTGKKRKQQHGIPDMQRKLTTRYKSIGTSNAHLCRNLLEKFEDGDVTEGQVGDILDHLGKLAKQNVRMVQDWRSRFESLIHPDKEPSQEE